MSRSHQLAWAAGFIDGDGFITIQDRTTKYKDKVYKGMYVRLGVNQVSQKPLEELQKIFGGTVRERNGGNKDGFNRKQQYQWCLSTSAACDAIKQIMPYLRNKSEVAELALDFQNTMSETKHKISEETLTYRAEIKTKIQHLNSLD